MTRIAVVGAGPAGLFFALLAKRRLGADVTVYEQNACDATFGFGVILSEGGHEKFREADPEVADAIAAVSCTRHGQMLRLDGETIAIDGGPWGGAIGRIDLLRALQALCVRRGIPVRHDCRIDNADRLDADLIVGADGVNSVVRKAYEGQFGATTWSLCSRMAWYGTTQNFPLPMLSFRRLDKGTFWAVGYSYAEGKATFVAECDAETWIAAGLNRMTADERRAFSGELFAEELGGHPLLSNRSDWSSLSVTRCKHWFVGHRVLIGDALHSPHPSIGSGTRIAMEDAIALVDALEQKPGNVLEAVSHFQAQHEPRKMKIVAAMEKSLLWYESIAQRLPTMNVRTLAFDYLLRTGRLSEDRLRSEYPGFMEKYGAGLKTWLTSESRFVS
jgi:2-polyprenyl-6-methoxyphenol hydroxylase-like FAD-dependent oxidoreductase